MDKKARLSCNNRGSTLILVIVCIGFVSILCSLLLTLTVNNYEMKAIDRKSKTNFYGTETVLDEIKAGLEQVTSEALETAYNNVMMQYLTYDNTTKQYISTTEAEKKQIFADSFKYELRTKIAVIGNDAQYDVDKLRSYIKTTPAALDVELNTNILEINTTNPVEPYISLKNVRINYTDANHYKTTITTDIIINTPDVSFGSIAGTFPKTFKDYSLIADNKISLNAASSLVQVTGNAYAGEGGISLDNNAMLQFSNSSNIVTRGDITVKNRGSLTVLKDPAASSPSNIWTKNITTQKGADTEDKTTIKIEGNCYVADDLSLDAKNSDVKITGEYYGYNYYPNTTSFTETDSAKNSSAIIINGLNSSLDLETDKLFIAGRAYLDPSSVGSSDNKLPTGESLAIKGNQFAYLVPDKCMWCGKNPVTQSEYDKVVADKTEQVTYDPEFGKYIATGVGYTKVFYPPSTGLEGLVYYYIKFRSDEKANEYMQDYYNTYNTNNNIGIINNRLKNYANNITIKSPIQSMISVGNLFTFSKNAVDNTFTSNLTNNNVAADGTGNTLSKALQLISSNLTRRYEGMQANLNEYSTNTLVNTPSIFESIIKKSKITSESLAGNGFDANGVKRVNVAGYVVYIVNNASSGTFNIPTDITLPDSGRKGIVIATGSVNVSNTYTGLILAGDTITLNSGATVNASESIVDTILGANSDDVNRYFMGYTNTGDTVTPSTDIKNIVVSDYIVYDNWKKNEE